MSAEYIEYLLHDFLGHIHGIRARRMFGSYGLFKDGTMFSLVKNDEMYFKVDDTNREYYKSAGSSEFTYVAKGKTIPLSYWLVMAESKDELEKLVMESCAIALKNKNKRRAKKRGGGIVHKLSVVNSTSGCTDSIK